LHHLRFGAVLLSAVEGLAIAFNIWGIMGVDATKQVSYTEDYADRFKHAYDYFFADMRLERTDAGYFSLELPLTEKEIEEVKGHKARARARQALKKKISLVCAKSVAAVMAGYLAEKVSTRYNS
jgi:uncharacterized protein VirK/YbjX